MTHTQRFPELELNPIDLQHNRTNWIAEKLIQLINDDLKNTPQDRNLVAGLRRALELVFESDTVNFNQTTCCATGTTGGKGKIMNKKLEKYIKSIRNNEKKRYAVDYIADVICHDNQTENRRLS